VVTAVANGDLTRQLKVEAKGEIRGLAETINNMTHTLGVFAEQVTDVARTVGVEGKLGAQAEVPGVAGTWKDLTDNVNLLANNLTAQVRKHRRGHHRGRAGRPVQEDHRRRARGDPALKDTVNTMVDQLNSFGAEVTRVAKEVGTEGSWAARRREGRVGRVEGLDRQRQLHGLQHHHPGARHRQGGDRSRHGELGEKLQVNAKGEIAALGETLNT